jgi:hypothetical protein
VLTINQARGLTFLVEPGHDESENQLDSDQASVGVERIPSRAGVLHHQTPHQHPSLVHLVSHQRKRNTNLLYDPDHLGQECSDPAFPVP